MNTRPFGQYPAFGLSLACLVTITACGGSGPAPGGTGAPAAAGAASREAEEPGSVVEVAAPRRHARRPVLNFRRRLVAITQPGNSGFPA